MAQPQVTGRKVGSEPVKLPAFLEGNRILDVYQMSELTNLSVAHIRRLYRTGKFPKPIQIAGRKLGWPAHVAMNLTKAA